MGSENREQRNKLARYESKTLLALDSASQIHLEFSKELVKEFEPQGFGRVSWDPGICLFDSLPMVLMLLRGPLLRVALSTTENSQQYCLACYSQ